MIISGVITGFERGDAESGMSTARMVSFAVFIILFIILQRPLCKYLCPYGALFGLFNLISLYRYKVTWINARNADGVRKNAKWILLFINRPINRNVFAVRTVSKHVLSRR
jgi:polyferredoxin